MRNACEIRDDLYRFDRMLADSMKPLTDSMNISRNLYANVIDKFTAGTQSSQDVEELRMAVDKLQL